MTTDDAGFLSRLIDDAPPVSLTEDALRLAGIVQFAPVGLDADGRIRWASQDFAEMAGRPAASLAGRPWSSLAGPSSEAREDKVRSGGRVFPLIRPDGQTRFLEWRFARSARAEGQAEILGFATDVTERETEAERLRAERAALAEQLRRADRLAKVGQMTAGVAHELNRPLGHILGFAQLAVKAPGLPESAGRDIDRIVQTALHAREIIRRLLRFGGHGPARIQSVDLNELVEDTLSFLEPIHGADTVTIQTALAAFVPRIAADPGQVRQVLVNLLVNGVQSMPRGGQLTVSTRFDGDGVTLAVRDTGTGMPPEVRDRIFEPFFTTRPADQGAGLGLAVVRDIVSAHRGRIDVESEPGAGTVIAVAFPSPEGPED
jgi:PAS domain S-box-containing protein